MGKKPKPLVEAMREAAPLRDAPASLRVRAQARVPRMLPAALQVYGCDVLNSRAGHSIREDKPIPVYTEVTLWPHGAAVLYLHPPNTGMKMCESTAQT